MPKLLDAVTTDTVGSATRVVGPTTIFSESNDYGGGTVSIYAQRDSSSTAILVGTFTGNGVLTDTIIGKHYLKATLAGSTNPAALTVATP